MTTSVPADGPGNPPPATTVDTTTTTTVGRLRRLVPRRLPIDAATPALPRPRARTLHPGRSAMADDRSGTVEVPPATGAPATAPPATATSAAATTVAPAGDDLPGRSDSGPGPGPASRLQRWGPGVGAVAVLLAASLPWIRDRPLWLDEAYTVGATHDLLATWRGSGGTQAIYYLLIWPVTRVSTDAFWLRFPSVVVAAGIVLATYALGTRLRSRRAGALAALTLASTWGLARYALEARSYALATLLVTLSWWGLVGVVGAGDDATDEAAADTARHRWWRLHAAALLLAPLAHGMAALHFGGQLVAWALAPRGRVPWRRVALLGAGLVVEGALLFSLGAGEVADWVPPLSLGQVGNVVSLLFGPGFVGPVVAAVALFAAVAAVRGLRAGNPGNPGGSGDPRPTGLAALQASTVAGWRPVVPVIWALAAPLALLTLSAVRPYGIARYVLGSLPAVALLVGAGLDRLRPRWAPLVGAAVVVAVLLAPHEQVTEGGREDWPALVERLTTEAADGDRLVAPDKYRPPIDYYWPDAGAPDLVPAAPNDPIGEVQRFYDDEVEALSDALRERLLAEAETDSEGAVWYVDRGPAGLGRIEALLADPAIAAAYDAAPTETFTGRLHLTRLVPR